MDHHEKRHLHFQPTALPQVHLHSSNQNSPQMNSAWASTLQILRHPLKKITDRPKRASSRANRTRRALLRSVGTNRKQRRYLCCRSSVCCWLCPRGRCSLFGRGCSCFRWLELCRRRFCPRSRDKSSALVWGCSVRCYMRRLPMDRDIFFLYGRKPPAIRKKVPVKLRNVSFC